MLALGQLVDCFQQQHLVMLHFPTNSAKRLQENHSQGRALVLERTVLGWLVTTEKDFAVMPVVKLAAIAVVVVVVEAAAVAIAVDVVA